MLCILRAVHCGVLAGTWKLKDTQGLAQPWATPYRKTRMFSAVTWGPWKWSCSCRAHKGRSLWGHLSFWHWRLLCSHSHVLGPLTCHFLNNATNFYMFPCLCLTTLYPSTKTWPSISCCLWGSLPYPSRNNHSFYNSPILVFATVLVTAPFLFPVWH